MQKIIVKDVSKIYGENSNKVIANDAISFDINEGEFVVILGPSGAGKSTLLNIIGGMDNASKGSINIFGKEIVGLSEAELTRYRREDIGFVFQFYNLVQNLTVEENILLPLKMMKNKDRSEFNEIVEIMGIRNILRKYPNQLSGGQQQRVAIARAVITKPNVILADEPTGNLDSSNGEAVMELFKKINQCKNITIIQVTHDEDKAEYGDRLIRLKDGRVVEDTQL